MRFSEDRSRRRTLQYWLADHKDWWTALAVLALPALFLSALNPTLKGRRDALTAHVRGAAATTAAPARPALADSGQPAPVALTPQEPGVPLGVQSRVQPATAAKGSGWRVQLEIFNKQRDAVEGQIWIVARVALPGGKTVRVASADGIDVDSPGAAANAEHGQSFKARKMTVKTFTLTAPGGAVGRLAGFDVFATLGKTPRTAAFSAAH
jgi:hypothetical protein